MTEREIKRKLEDDGFRLRDVARDLQQTHSATVSSLNSAEVMLHRLISGQAWYPRYAAWLKKEYGVIVNKPDWVKGVRERMKLAA